MKHPALKCHDADNLGWLLLVDDLMAKKEQNELMFTHQKKRLISAAQNQRLGWFYDKDLNTCKRMQIRGVLSIKMHPFCICTWIIKHKHHILLVILAIWTWTNFAKLNSMSHNKSNFNTCTLLHWKAEKQTTLTTISTTHWISVILCHLCNAIYSLFIRKNDGQVKKKFLNNHSLCGRGHWGFEAEKKAFCGRTDSSSVFFASVRHVGL